MKPSITSRKREALVRAAAVFFWLAVWQGASMAIGQELLLVSPVRAVMTLFDLMKTASFYRAVFSSLGRIALGFVLAAVLGVLLAALAGRWRAVRILLEPLMHAVKATPVASFVILALIFIKSRHLSVFISFLMVLPVMYTNVLAGIDATDRGLLEMARVFRLGAARTIMSVYWDCVYPYFLSACVLALGLCWKAGVAAEVIGLPAHSIGEALYQAKLFFNTPELFAWTIAIVLLSVGFERLFVALAALIGRRMGGR